MSKLSFRAKALDASKPMPIYMADELPDLPDYSAINRAVPQMPSGMKKEEECEHHLQRAICTGLIIPTPEVSDIQDEEIHTKLYPANYKQPRQLIHMQPFAMEQDITDYDMDSEDERWLEQQAARQRLELAPLKFEEMMDRLEKSSGQTVVSISDAKALLKEDDDLIIAVFDYWLNKRLKMQHPLILAVKTEHRTGTAPNNPYLAFRRRTEKMQTRKNRKNGETSYEKMLKLRRDLSRAVTLLELVKRREKTKREVVLLTLEVVEKRYAARDFSGAVAAEAAAAASAQLLQRAGGGGGGGAPARPAFTPLFHNHYAHNHHHHHATAAAAAAAGGSSGGAVGGGGAGSGGAASWQHKAILKDEAIGRKERRQYKKRKHKGGRSGTSSGLGDVGGLGAGISSDEDTTLHRTAALSPEPHDDDDGPFAFRRNKLCTYHEALPTICGTWPWQAATDDLDPTTNLKSPLSPSGDTTTSAPPQQQHTNRCRGATVHPPPDKRYRYTLTSITTASDGEDSGGGGGGGGCGEDQWRRRRRRCVGFARRRLGRGGRVILDRSAAPGFPLGGASDDFWAALNYTIYDSAATQTSTTTTTAAAVTTNTSAPSSITIKQEPVTDAPSASDTRHNHNSDSCGNSNSYLFTNSLQQQQRRLSDGSASGRTSSGVCETVLAGVVCKVEGGVEGVDSARERRESAAQVAGAEGVSNSEKDEQDEMVEFIQQVRRDWLHFRPKTPPPDYTPPCHLLPPLDDTTYLPTDLPFTLELRPLLDTTATTSAYHYDRNVLLDQTPFITTPFELDGLDGDWSRAAVGDSGVWSALDGFDGGGGSSSGDEGGDDECGRRVVDVTDTRQERTSDEPQTPQSNITLNNTKPVGSSTFSVRDIHTNQPIPSRKTTRTLTTPQPPPKQQQQQQQPPTTTNTTNNRIPTTNTSSTSWTNAPLGQQPPIQTLAASATTTTTTVNSTTRNNVLNQQRTTTTTTMSGTSAAVAAIVKQQHCLPGGALRGVVTSLQHGGNGSRAGLLWRDHGLVKGADGGGLVQTNGIVTQLELDVSSGVRPKNNRHHTFTSAVESNRSNTNTINIHGTLNSHSGSLLDIPMSGAESAIVGAPRHHLPHPKVGVGGTVTAAPITSPAGAGSGATAPPTKAAIVRKNNLVMEVT